MKNLYLFLALSIVLGNLSGCKKGEHVKETDEFKKAAVKNYSNIVYASYSDALTAAQTLKTTIDDFVASPDATKFQACKDAWLAARIPYNQTEPYRFYDGPVDDANGPEGLMNAWPLDENYIDYVSGNASAGMVNDGAYTTITVSDIETANGANGETDVKTGYHAIEFLLWGQDLSTSGPGARAYTDYTTATNAAKRGQYLKAAAELLVTNLQYVTNQWAPDNASNYRAAFESDSPNESLRKIFQGAGAFSKGELAGERMAVAFEEQLQEHEHSCFSDNTHNDIIDGAKGIQNVISGKYIRTNGEVIQGVSILGVVALENMTLSKDIETNVAQSVTLASEIPTPFDQQILPAAAGGEKVQSTINSLRAQADLLVQAASELGLGNITVE